MCFNDFETNKFNAKKFLIDSEIRSLDDVCAFSLKYFKPKTGENYLFMKLIEMLIDENTSLKEEIKKLKRIKNAN